MARNIDDILAAKKPNETTYQILLEPTLRSEIEDTKRALARAQRQERGDPGLAGGNTLKLEKRLEELETKAEELSVTFRFRGLGRRANDELMARPEHRPTDEQKAEFKKEGGQGELTFNTETYPPALIAATCIEPEGMTLEKAQRLFDDWTTGDVEGLFTAAMMACRERSSVPFGRSDIEQILASVSNSTTPPNEGSPTAGS